MSQERLLIKQLTRKLSVRHMFDILLIVFLLFISSSIFAQGKIISGKIVDENGGAIIGATVTVKGTNVGTITDVKGNYSLNVPGPNAVITVSFVGFITKEQTVNDQQIINFTLAESSQQLNDLIVTAMGVKKDSRNIGYAVMEVNGDDMNKAREANAMTSLAGKVSGLTVGPSPELLGSPKIILRGNMNVLVVVDGVPVNSDSWNVNADDIDTYTVLKGPNAAALYGFRGQYGAILITTKKGSGNGQSKVEFNSTTMFDAGFTALPVKQHEYGAGDQYKYAMGNDPIDLDGKYRRPQPWGPRFEGQAVPQWDSPIVNGIRQGTPWLDKGKGNNYKNFIEEGITNTSNLTFSTGNQKYNLRLSATNTSQKYMYPNTGLNSNNISLTSGYNINSKLRVDGWINYSRQNSDNVPDAFYSPNSYIYMFYNYGSDHWNVKDMKNYWQPGQEGIQQIFAEYGRCNNPYFMAYNWLRGYNKNSIDGYVKLSYAINKFTNFNIRSSASTWNLMRNEKLPKSGIAYGRGLALGDYYEDDRTLFENNNDAFFTFNKNLGTDFYISALAGGNIRNFTYRSSWTGTNYLLVPNVYSFSNSLNPVLSYSFDSEMEVYSAYYSIDLSYKKFFTLSTTGRIDQFSTLPKDTRAPFYPSVNLSSVISDYIKLPELISYLKIRGSYANNRGGGTQSNIGPSWQALGVNNPQSYGTVYTTPYDGPSYNNQAGYNIVPYYNNVPTASYSNTLANPKVKPFTVNSYEAGGEIRFLKNRFGVDGTYFQTINGPNIYSLPVAPSSGYTNQIQNAITTKKTGFEISANAVILQRQNGLNWEVKANYSTYKEVLKDIYPGVNAITVYDFYDTDTQNPYHELKKGDRMDGIYGHGFYNNQQGQMIYSNGLPLYVPNWTPKNSRRLGYANPDYTWSINNTITYKSLSLSFQIDGRVGGKIWDQLWGHQFNSGNAIDDVTGDLGAARLKEWESVKASSTQAVTAAYIGKGVKINSGTAAFDDQGNIKNMGELSFLPNDVAVTVQSYCNNVFQNAHEPFMVDKTFAKLREVTLSYKLPVMKKLFKECTLSAVGRNLIYFAKRRYLDMDSYAAGFNASDSKLFDAGLFSTPMTRQLGLNIKLTF